MSILPKTSNLVYGLFIHVKQLICGTAKLWNELPQVSLSEGVLWKQFVYQLLQIRRATEK